MNRQDALRLLVERSEEIRRRFSVKDLAIFGSTARDETRFDSDLDVLVSFEGPSEFDRFMDLKFYLEEVLGVKVDLVTQRELLAPNCGRKSNRKRSMSRDWRIYLDDILRACGKIRRFTAGMSQAALLADERTMDAVIRNLEIIGEAAKHVPEDARQRMPQIEWRKVTGFRDVLAHAYFGVDPEILWDVIQNKLTPLEEAVQAFPTRRGSCPCKPPI